MEYTKIPKTDIQISRIGFGTRTLDLNSPFKSQLINTAIDLGINFFCTTAHYQNGAIEREIGKLVNPIREDIVLATSGGVTHDESGINVSSRPDALEKSLKSSLTNLQTDYIDHYEIHFYDPFADISQTGSFLSEYLESNIIKSVGVSNFPLNTLKEWEAKIPISLVQIPLNPIQMRSYNLFLPFCQEKNLKLLTYSPFFSGILSKPFSTLPSAYQSPSIIFPEVWIDKVKKIFPIFKQKLEELNYPEINIPRLILQWILSKNCVAGLLMGTNDINHLEDNATLFNDPFPKNLIYKIDSIINENIQEIIPLSVNSRPYLRESVINIKEYGKDEKIAITSSGLSFKLPKTVERLNNLMIDIETGEILLN